nr:hypothetical protein [Tatlockia sp.]
THSNFAKALINYVANWIKGIIYPTQPWEGEVGRFHTYASELIAKSKPSYPLWMKGWHFLKAVGTALKDTVRGIRNFGQQFTIYLRLDLQNDWASTKKLPELKDTFTLAEKQINWIQKEELKILKGLKQFTQQPVEHQHLKVLAEPDYHLSYGEEHDLFTAMVQGFGGFAGHFTHNLFTKDPVGALIFSSAFMVGGISIFFPLTAKTFFGSPFVNWFTEFSKLVGSGTTSQAFCGSLTFGQLWHSAYCGFSDGPSSEPLSVLTKVLEDPLTSAFLFTAAYGIGYALAHVPLIGEYIRAELGTSDILNYPVIGVKLGVGGILILVSHDIDEPQSIVIPYDSEQFSKILHHLDKDPIVMQEVGKMMRRLELVQWLAKNAPLLSKLEPDTQFEIERHIDDIFKGASEQAISLKKLIYPEKDRSVAYQSLTVPFGYIPALLRLGASFISSAIAWLMSNKLYTEPVSYAGGALLRKMAKDLSRIYTASSYSLQIAVNIVASPFKALLLIANMLIGRITAFAEVPSGHFLHKGFWFIHNIYCRIGEVLSFVRPQKSVVFANPVHTIFDVVQTMDVLMEGSYVRFGKSLAGEKKQELPVEAEQPGQYQKVFQPQPLAANENLDSAVCLGT